MDQRTDRQVIGPQPASSGHDRGTDRSLLQKRYKKRWINFLILIGILFIFGFGYYYFIHTPLGYCPKLERDLEANAFIPIIDKRRTDIIVDQFANATPMSRPAALKMIFNLPQDSYDWQRIRCHVFRSDEEGWRADVDYRVYGRSGVFVYRVVWVRNLTWKVAMIAPHTPLKY